MLWKWSQWKEWSIFMIFTVENLNIQLLIRSYLQSLFIKELHYNNCKVDCVMNLITFYVKLSFSKVHFSVQTLFVIVHVSSNSKKLLYANLWNIVVRGSILKIENVHFFGYIQFESHNSFTIIDSKLVYILISKLSKHLSCMVKFLKKKIASLRTIVNPCSFFIGKTSLKWLSHLWIKVK